MPTFIYLHHSGLLLLYSFLPVWTASIFFAFLYFIHFYLYYYKEEKRVSNLVIFSKPQQKRPLFTNPAFCYNLSSLIKF